MDVFAIEKGKALKLSVDEFEKQTCHEYPYYRTKKDKRLSLVAMDGLMAKSYVTGNNILIDDVKKEKDYYCAVFQTRSELVLPIKYGGKIIGVFNSESEETNYYTKEMVEQLYKILENFSSRIIELGYVGNMNHGDIPYVHI